MKPAQRSVQNTRPSPAVPAAACPARPRLALLDCIRGIALLSMIIYHACWDIVYIHGADWPWYSGVYAYLWQQSICCGFILLSGFCAFLGRRPLRRGLTVFFAGCIITAATAAFFPQGKIIFGILTLLGTCMLLTPLFQKLTARIPALWGFGVSLLLFLLLRDINRGSCLWGLARLPDFLYQGYWGAYLGFTPAWFQSADYFPVLPWMFLFLSGFFAGKYAVRRNLLERLTGGIPLLAWMGRHSLLLYLLHQPVLAGLMLLWT